MDPAVIDLSKARETRRRVAIAREYHAAIQSDGIGEYVRFAPDALLRFDVPYEAES